MCISYQNMRKKCWYRLFLKIIPYFLFIIKQVDQEIIQDWKLVKSMKILLARKWLGMKKLKEVPKIYKWRASFSMTPSPSINLRCMYADC